MITATKTPTGDWITIDRLVTAADFKVILDGPKWNNQPQSTGAYIGKITIVPKQALIDNVMLGVSDPCQFAALFERTPLSGVRSRFSTQVTYAGVISRLEYTRGTAISANLKNVTKETTRRVRMTAAKAECARVLSKGGGWVSEVMDDFLKEFNAGLASFVGAVNTHTQRALEAAMKSDKAWRNHADEHGTHGDLLQEIESAEREIAALEEALSAKYDALKSARIEAWRAVWEKDGWRWTNHGVTRCLPDDYRDLMVVALDEGTAFQSVPKHRRALLLPD